MPETPPQQWEDLEEQLRADWERNYPNTPWNDISYGYRYGWESARQSSGATDDWDTNEPELARSWNDWQSTHRNGSLSQQLQQGW
ncbi:MAG TPA: hypothetical protein VFX76_01090, partial [Roseiflexaceae bacterium]|nr:hypothetical protein [Roseiflexaceae bacterium]